MKPARWLMKAVLVALVVLGYPALMHLLLTSGQWPVSTLLLGLAPLTALPLALLLAGRINLGLATLATLVAAVGYGWNTLLHSQDWIYLIQNVSMQSLLAWGFGHTLRPGHEPLISQIARRIHGADYTPLIATYTRRATWAWALFSLTMGLISILLFAVAPLATWSFFVNFVSLILLGLMFVLEYAARRYCLRGIPHVPFFKGISLYWESRDAADEKP
jgi:uncharacterized membrane protein